MLSSHGRRALGPCARKVRHGLAAGGRWIRTFGSARKGRPISALAFVYVPETVRVLTQRSTLLGAGGSKSRSRQANGANSDHWKTSSPRPNGLALKQEAE